MAIGRSIRGAGGGRHRRRGRFVVVFATCVIRRFEPPASTAKERTSSMGKRATVQRIGWRSDADRMSDQTEPSVVPPSANQPVDVPGQNPHALGGARDNMLEVAIGREVRAFRTKLGITGGDLAAATGLSLGMLSKIENGMTSPSLTTLQALSRALGVPVTAFFRRFEERRGAVFVKAGEGLAIERRGHAQRPPVSSARSLREIAAPASWSSPTSSP